MVIESLRDSGFSNTAYAVAELIDNSLQAGAGKVELGFIEEQCKTATGRFPYTVSEIAIWDNGRGMDPETLRIAMQFGGGKHRDDEAGMGKFGMGLPNSSISQCKRVDVWSWQKNSDAHYTYLDVDEMKSGRLETVPEPKKKDIPEAYAKAFFSKKPESGTLVVWSKLDRLSWKTGNSIYRHCENLVGRMYRNFICEDKIKIYSKTYRKVGNESLVEMKRASHLFKANDPMYLLKGTSLPDLPGGYKKETFFELTDEENIAIEYSLEGGEVKRDNVRIKTSIVKKSIADEILKKATSKLGGTKWGKHCSRNIGVSIVRANRELVLNNQFLTATLRENKGRFIGIEMSFPPTLDAVFGVTNNKQNAVRLIPYDMKPISVEAGFDSEREYLRDLDDNGDPLSQVLKVVSVIKKQISALSKQLDHISVEPKGRSGSNSDVADKSPEELAAGVATHGSEKREMEGHHAKGKVDHLDKEDIVEHLIKKVRLLHPEAERVADRLLLTGNHFLIENFASDSEAFFDVSTSKGLTLVLFNTNHIFYDKFLKKLGAEELEVMQTAIAGFARVMNETTDVARLRLLNSARRDWGVVISDFLAGGLDEDNEVF